MGVVGKLGKEGKVRMARERKKVKINEEGICVYFCLQDSTCTPWVFTSCERTNYFRRL